MSKKATSINRMAASATTGARRRDDVQRAVSRARGIARGAHDAAVVASCAANRAGASMSAAANAFALAREVEAAADEAVETARRAITAADRGDAVGAAVEANLSARAAQRAASLSAAASIVVGKERASLSGEAALDRTAADIRRRVDVSAREAEQRALSEAIDHSARYLVTYDGRVMASFALEEDALLFESERADLDLVHGVESGRCEVVDRRTGHRLGGYLLTGGKMLSFLRDEDRERRFGKRRG